MKIVLVVIGLLIAAEMSAARLALGLAPLDRGLSVWLTGEKTWVGVELNRFELSSNSETIPVYLRDYVASDAPWDGVDHLTRRVGGAVTVQRFLSLDMVAPFVYLRFYLGISHEEWGHYYHDNWTEAGPEVGGGILWCPVRRVGLMVWQGVTVEESDRRNPIDRRYVSDRSTRTVRLQETRLLFLFRF